MEMAMSEGLSAAGGVRTLLRLEGLALFAAALLLYAQSGAGWTLFLVLFLVPDLSFAFYLFGPRAGAFAYNTMHSTIGPIMLALASRMVETSAPLFAIALIWLAHVGFDRVLGYGLKYASDFGDTHLGAIGRKRRQLA
jgi:hypothetical protein